MTIDTKDILNSILASISRIDYIKLEEIPGIPLYMDQVTTFMEEHLSSSKRYPEDKVLTKTMINNYAKNHPTSKEEIFQRAYFNADLYLLFQKHYVYQRYSGAFRSCCRKILPR